MKDTVTDKALRQFADLMVKKIEEVRDDWRKPWFTCSGCGLPQNIEGRAYHGVNSFMLYLLQERRGYQLPVYMTFLQAKSMGLRINKGESSFPVLYWNFSVKDDKGNKLPFEEYKRLEKEEQERYKVTPYVRIYPIFNVEQTNLKELHPDKWIDLVGKFQTPGLKDEKGMYSSAEIDKMLKCSSWHCPIFLEFGDKAYYSPSTDSIHLPLKGQFETGERFYSTLLHEMAHSTGIESRLGREVKNLFGDPKYAKEELVAEMSAAVCSQSIGITSCIQEANAKYLKNWLAAIKEEPRFLFSVLTDVGKACNMILDVVCEKKHIQEKSQDAGQALEGRLKAGGLDKQCYLDTQDSSVLSKASHSLTVNTRKRDVQLSFNF